MDVLVLVQDYPSVENIYTMNYAHTRNLEYVNQGIKLIVLSFSANKTYKYDGIEVISLNEFNQSMNNRIFDLVISHAPNVRNHLRFLQKFEKNIKNIIMFIHGHEVMKVSNYYPAPFPYEKISTVKTFVRDTYDVFKLKTFKKYTQQMFNKNKLKFIFVSNWMMDVFLANIPLDHNLLKQNSYVIPNSMNTVFLETNYSKKAEVKADFVTIRPLDNPKYGVDLVVALAKLHPKLTFHIYGKGEYFQHNEKPENIEVFQQFFTPDELAELFNNYSCAMLPTRLDAQGVMMCEVATYGMPLVTSSLPICSEMLNSFDNVFYFDNESLNIDLYDCLNKINLDQTPNKDKFSLTNTVLKELDVIKTFLQ